MANIHDGEVELGEYFRSKLELKTTVRLSAEDLVALITDLPSEQFDWVMIELAYDSDIANKLFERQCSSEQVEIAGDHLDLNQIEEILRDTLTDAQRKELFDAFCIHCGSTDDPCWCKCDD